MFGSATDVLRAPGSAPSSHSEGTGSSPGEVRQVRLVDPLKVKELEIQKFEFRLGLFSLILKPISLGISC